MLSLFEYIVSTERTTWPIRGCPASVYSSNNEAISLASTSGKYLIANFWRKSSTGLRFCLNVLGLISPVLSRSSCIFQYRLSQVLTVISLPLICATRSLSAKICRLRRSASRLLASIAIYRASCSLSPRACYFPVTGCRYRQYTLLALRLNRGYRLGISTLFLRGRTAIIQYPL